MRLTHLATALGIAVFGAAGAASADMAAMTPDELAAWSSAYSEIKAMEPKWGVQGGDAFHAMSAAGVPVVYLDVRTAEEREKGVVAGAVQVALTELPTEAGMAALPEDKSVIVAVYCKSGHRSALAIPLMHRLGYINATSMKGGYEGWVKAGFPTE
jgi:rhodanese-related sulfurtransferase